MFNYTDKMVMNTSFKMNDLYKMIKADKTIKADASQIKSVQLTHALSQERTNLEPSKDVKEIYIIKIEVGEKRIPEQFISAFDKQIFFQTLFKVCYGDEITYMTTIKEFCEDGKIKALKTYSTSWQKELKEDLPITTKLEVVYKTIVANISGYKFKQDETFNEFINRLTSIKKLKAEIEKQTGMMNREKQPNMRMAMNDKIKEMRKQLNEMEE